ncbi:uncharacterized protein LOC111909982 [Lactuca sativa]|nr:uncharacterized protein LOC111909982 [Lactuca sativa]
MKKASSSTASTDYNDFQSREKTFTQALKALEPNNASHMIALCGMGGVGKTTMMQRLKKVVKQNRMFSYMVEAVIGEKTDPIAIQQAVADYLRIELKESTKPARADKLREWFKANSGEGKNKFLVILDDVWQSVDLEDIGLSPFPNQGVDFKVLLTSRDEHVCTVMGVGSNSILNVGLLIEAEAQSLFQQFVETSEPELHKIGEDIVRKCCGLPIAIKTMACTLRNKRKDAWKDALSRIEHYDLRNVAPKVFETSYHNLHDKETKSVFLMCGLFPEDFNIPTEELMRYGWGLKIFDRVYTFIKARNRINTCIERLVQTNLLIESDDVGCVKMHDLVRAFVLGMYSEVEHASVVNHGNMPRWTENDTTDSCKAISLTCESMSGNIPGDFKFPNLTILKLMHGDKSLRFPQDFYEGMEKLQVISYDKMKYPMLPLSPQCSTNLRVLHLHECSLKMFDCSCIGNMANVEVLSFANSGIEMLPSTIGNLKKLRLLDLTDCHGLHITHGVFNNLVKLEELYMGFSDRPDQTRGNISMTDVSYNELAECSKGLSALEFQFFENNAQPNNMSFGKLKRFKISMGCTLYGGSDYFKKTYPVQNTLKLVTNKGELLDSRMNELFVETEMLCLSVDDMNDLGDVCVKSSRSPQPSVFKILRVFVVSKCVELRYLFTIGVAKDLSNLEHLEVDSCNNMEQLICIENAGKETITLLKLKILSLSGLPKLSGLCQNVNKLELPQLIELKLKGIPGFTCIYPQNKLETSSLLKEEVVIPKLETLQIDEMENLKEIWHYKVSNGERVKLRKIEVSNCDKLVNLFPHNPMSLLHHLEELEVKKCGSIESLFNIDLDCVDAIGEEDNMRSLRNIKVKNSWKLREVWCIKGENNSCPLVSGFQAVESISIESCKRFRNVFTPTTTNFNMGALLEISIDDCGEYMENEKSEKSSQEQEQTDILSEEVKLQAVTDTISNVVFTSCLIHSFYNNLRKLNLEKYGGVEVVFEIESSTSRELVTTYHKQQQQQQPIFPNLEELYLYYMDNMSHVWKCNNWNKFLQQSESPFHNLTTIHMSDCKSIKYLFSPLMAELLSNLKRINIDECDGIEEIVSKRDDVDEEMTTSTHSSTILFPHLDSLTLFRLDNLKCIGGGGAFLDRFKFSQAGVVCWSLCQYSREIEIRSCHALSSVIPCYASGQMQKLRVLKIERCKGVKEVFETQGISSNKNNKSGCDEGNDEIPRVNSIIMLPNLMILEISKCGSLEHIFTFSALESLRQLEELMILDCGSMKVIVKEEHASSSSSSKEAVVFPRLKSIKLFNLPELEGFFLGMNEFRWPSLAYVVIKNCPQMTVFAPGGSTAPMLKHIHTALGKHSLGESGLNFHNVAHRQTPFPSLHGAISCPVTTEGMRWSFHNLIELDVGCNRDVKKIIPSSEMLQLQKLEKIHVRYCHVLEEVFETALESATTTTTVFNLPNLRHVELKVVSALRYIWKSNRWTVFDFPNLTRVDIRGCERLEHVFTSSMVGSLLQLQELHIWDCYHMEEIIVKDTNVDVEADEESDGKTNEIVLPCLKSLTLDWLPCLKGFSLGKEDFSFPLLDTLEINNCPEITTFTKGNSATPRLKEIETSFGSFFVAETDINSFIKIKQKVPLADC